MKRVILSILVLFPLWSLAQEKYLVNGKIQLNQPNGKAYLYYRKENKIFRDSAIIEKGKFQFTGLIADPLKAVMAISPKGAPIANVDKADHIVVYLEKGEILVETKDSLISHARLNGTTLNKERQELTDSLGSLSKSSKSYQAKTDAFIQKHPGSFVSLNVLRAEINPGMNTERAQKMLDALSPALRNTTEGKNYQGWINAVVAVSVGHMAPSFTSKNPDDKPVSLDSYRGKYVLIDFWASWCGPCRQENPNLIAAYEKYKAKNFNILGVSLDGGTNGKKLWIDAIKKDGLTWEQVSDLNGGDGKIPKMYMVEIIPSNFLIDPSGKIIAKNLRGKELEKKLAEIFGS